MHTVAGLRCVRSGCAVPRSPRLGLPCRNSTSGSRSAEHARRTSCHPELVPLRCCLRLCETTPVPLPQVLPLLAQCYGSLVLSTSKRAALYKFLHALLSRDLKLPVFIVPPVS